jgi:hypothetical protein
VNPFLSKAVATKAVSLAQSALQNEAVRKQIRDAPEAVGRWAKSLQKPEGSTGGALANLARLDPTARFGQQGLERRLDALSGNVEMVFPDADDPTRRSTLHAVQELRRGLIVAAPLPLLKRKKVHLRIDAELAELEQALVDAVLPPTQDGDTASS